LIDIALKERILKHVNCQAIANNPTQIKLKINENKRVFIISDLDANLAKFEQALVAVDFDESNDVLFSLGDAIDRGNDNFALLSRFKELRVYMTLGNHEHMMLESLLADDHSYYSLWVENGGRWHTQATDDELKAIIEQLLQCPLSYLLDYAGMQIGLSHTVSADWNWQAPSEHKPYAAASLLWDRTIVKQTITKINASIDFSVHGHNTTAEPYWLGNTYHIDTHYLSGKPTIVELKPLIKAFQLNSV
tara:strand:- start:2428 stop:3171 length:744 start_codon:yes stop_codon:yes gene_type:complete